jgi:hypothetical protein
MPQCQFLFFAVFLLQIFTKGNILEIGPKKAKVPFFNTKTESKGETEKSQEAAAP